MCLWMLNVFLCNSVIRLFFCACGRAHTHGSSMRVQGVFFVGPAVVRTGAEYFRACAFDAFLLLVT